MIVSSPFHHPLSLLLLMRAGDPFFSFLEYTNPPILTSRSLSPQRKRRDSNPVLRQQISQGPLLFPDPLLIHLSTAFFSKKHFPPISFPPSLQALPLVSENPPCTSLIQREFASFFSILKITHESSVPITSFEFRLPSTYVFSLPYTKCPSDAPNSRPIFSRSNGLQMSRLVRRGRSPSAPLFLPFLSKDLSRVRLRAPLQALPAEHIAFSSPAPFSEQARI